MRVREKFLVRTSGDQKFEVDLPITFLLDDEERIEVSENEKDLLLIIERTVDPLELTIETKSGLFEQLPGGGRRELPTLRVPKGGNVRAIDVSSALTFLTDVAFQVNATGRELIPETEKDNAALSALGTRRVHVDTALVVNVRTFNPIVDPDAIKALVPKTVGLRLYADAIALPTDVARFRELWRCLESAFGVKNAQLVRVLGDYAPALEVGFDKKELGELHVLRGQISHAESRTGLNALLRAGDEASKRVPRLKSLVERVILTKRNWEMRDTAVEELTPAVSWISSDGGIVLRAAGS